MEESSNWVVQNLQNALATWNDNGDDVRPHRNNKKENRTR